MPAKPKIRKLTLQVDIYGDPYRMYAEKNLGLGNEENEISNAFRRGRYGYRFKAEKKFLAYADKIETKIKKENPEILHIACPAENGNLIFAKGRKAVEILQPDQFLTLLKQAAPQNLRLVVLRAFETCDLAKKIVDEFKCSVLYLKKKETAERCTEFLSAFYELLADGMTIGQSYRLAKEVASSRAFEIIHGNSTCSRFSFIETKKAGSFLTVFASNPSKIQDEKPAPGLAEELSELHSVISQKKIGSIEECYPSSRWEIIMKMAYNLSENVQFSSHANYNTLAFYTASGEKMTLEKYWLLRVMKEFRQYVHCLILNSCMNSPIAYDLSEHIDFVVGTLKEVSGRESVEFVKSFYSALAGQKGVLDYQKAFDEASTYVGKLFGTHYQAYAREEFQIDIKRQLNSKMLETKELFLEQYRDTNDRTIQFFRDHFEDWYSRIQQFTGMEKFAVNFLKHFSYYSEASVREALRELYGMLVKEIPQSDAGNTIFCPVPEATAGLTGSSEYWFDFCRINPIPKGKCIFDVVGHESAFSKVKQVVFIDDFSAEGESFIRYMQEHALFLAEKKVYYCTIHAMEAGRSKIMTEAKNANIQLTYLSVFNSKKAFQLYNVSAQDKKDFADNCKALGIPEDQILGRGDAGALVAFYNRVPEENMGLLCRPFIVPDPESPGKTKRMAPLFPVR